MYDTICFYIPIQLQYISTIYNRKICVIIYINDNWKLNAVICITVCIVTTLFHSIVTYLCTECTLSLSCSPSPPTVLPSLPMVCFCYTFLHRSTYRQFVFSTSLLFFHQFLPPLFTLSFFGPLGLCAFCSFFQILELNAWYLFSVFFICHFICHEKFPTKYWFNCVPKILACSISLFLSYEYFVIFLTVFFLTQGLFNSMLLSFQA